MLKHHDGKFFESLNLLFIDLLKFQSWIFLILAEVQNTMNSAHFWTFSGFFGFFGIYTLRKKSGRTMVTPGALILKYKGDHLDQIGSFKVINTEHPKSWIIHGLKWSYPF